MPLGTIAASALKGAASFAVLAMASTLLLVGSARATVFLVTVDTSLLSGDAVMAFDFANSDGDASHRLDIFDFTTDGTLFASAPDPANCPFPPFPFSVNACKDPADTDVTGTLDDSGTVSISDAGSSGIPTITYYQRITLGSSIQFKFEMSGDATSPGAAPDGFAFWLLNPGDPQSPDQNPGGDLLGPGPLILYTLGGECDASASADPITAPRTASCTPVGDVGVPEPKSLALVAAALLAVIIARTRPGLRRV